MHEPEELHLDRKGSYIPPCTRNVLLKYYTDDADQQIHMWGDCPINGVTGPDAEDSAGRV